MQRFCIVAAPTVPRRSPPFSFPAPQFSEPFADILHRHCITAAMLLAIAIGSCRSETHAQQAVATHAAADGSAMAVSAFIVEASRRFDIPEQWIRAVMHAESTGNLRAVSPKGAMGLMQIMPETWSYLRRRYHLGIDPYDAHDNIIAGTGYLRELYDSYGALGFLAAYNAGPARWEDYLASGKALPLETRDFLVRLAPVTARNAIDDAILNASTARSWTNAPLFPELATSNRATSDLQALHSPDSRSAPDSTEQALRSNGLFVVLTSAGQSQ